MCAVLECRNMRTVPDSNVTLQRLNDNVAEAVIVQRCVCVCVYVREKEREKAREDARARKRKGERENAQQKKRVCVRERKGNATL